MIVLGRSVGKIDYGGVLGGVNGDSYCNVNVVIYFCDKLIGF